ncbi:DNA-3-methyladenine glycosylase 2 family protein [Candidatus Thorarchaeota archaeon]|nr:MAG: DNA-3-methyladenine glycosylase 2 family protein [Candidatus Thorarchaeota archaeon]
MKDIEVENFSLKASVECGQTFSWKRAGAGYVNADVGQVIYVEQQDDVLYYETSDFSMNVERLLRLDDPLQDIQREINKDSLIQKSIQYAPGLRIVNDPFYPCLISFISSTRKNIPSIKRILDNLRERYGTRFDFRGASYYGMPTPEQMSNVTVQDLRRCELGYRAKFIRRSTEAILTGETQPDRIAEMPYEEAHSELKKLHGVGNKVADCVCLFSLGHLEAFPIDVWIERAIKQQNDIFEGAGKSYAKKSEAARKYYGKYAGYAQEYLYFYTRSTYDTNQFGKEKHC